MGRPPKLGKRRQMEQKALARQRAEEDVKSIFEKYLPNNVFDDLENELSECVDTKTCVDTFQFSFERVPVRESWFVTYSRQDQVSKNQYFKRCMEIKCHLIYRTISTFLTKSLNRFVYRTKCGLPRFTPRKLALGRKSKMTTARLTWYIFQFIIFKDIRFTMSY